MLVYPTGMTPEDFAESLVPAEESEEENAESVEAEAAVEEEEASEEEQNQGLTMPAPPSRGFPD